MGVGEEEEENVTPDSFCLFTMGGDFQLRAWLAQPKEEMSDEFDGDGETLNSVRERVADGTDVRGKHVSWNPSIEEGSQAESWESGEEDKEKERMLKRKYGVKENLAEADCLEMLLGQQVQPLPSPPLHLPRTIFLLLGTCSVDALLRMYMSRLLTFAMQMDIVGEVGVKATYQMNLSLPVRSLLELPATSSELKGSLFATSVRLLPEDEQEAMEIEMKIMKKKKARRRGRRGSIVKNALNASSSSSDSSSDSSDSENSKVLERPLRQPIDYSHHDQKQVEAEERDNEGDKNSREEKEKEKENENENDNENENEDKKRKGKGKKNENSKEGKKEEGKEEEEKLGESDPVLTTPRKMPTALSATAGRRFFIWTAEEGLLKVSCYFLSFLNQRYFCLVFSVYIPICQ